MIFHSYVRLPEGNFQPSKSVQKQKRFVYLKPQSFPVQHGQSLKNADKSWSMESMVRFPLQKFFITREYERGIEGILLLKLHEKISPWRDSSNPAMVHRSPLQFSSRVQNCVIPGPQKLTPSYKFWHHIALKPLVNCDYCLGWTLTNRMIHYLLGFLLTLSA